MNGIFTLLMYLSLESCVVIAQMACFYCFLMFCKLICNTLTFQITCHDYRFRQCKLDFNIVNLNKLSISI